MNLLALDLGTTTGFRVGTSTAAVGGIVKLKPGRFESSGMRFVRFRRWLNEIAAAHGPLDHVAFEEVRRHAATDAAHVYGGLMAVLTEWCVVNGVEYEGVPVGTIKSHWTGKGNADKAAMIAGAKRRGLDPVDDNEADAMALFDFILSGAS